VFVHFHDVFYPFEYPSAWVYSGRTWSEAYLLRAFLSYNREFEIVLFNTFLEHFHRQMFGVLAIQVHDDHFRSGRCENPGRSCTDTTGATGD